MTWDMCRHGKAIHILNWLKLAAGMHFCIEGAESVWETQPLPARCACERPHLVRRHHATWHGPRLTSRTRPFGLPTLRWLLALRQFNCIPSQPVRQEAVFGCTSGRHPRAMALGFSALLVTAVLLAAGSGLPRAAGGRALAPAPSPSAAAGDRVKSLPEFGKLGPLRMYSG